MIVSGLGVVDLVVVYLVPLGVLLVACLLLAFTVFLSLRLPVEYAFKADLLRKFDEKSRLASARHYRPTLVGVTRVLCGDSCVQAVLLHRVARFLLVRRMRPLAEAVSAFARIVTHTDISPHAEIGSGLYVYHGLGLVVGKNCKIGRNVTLCQSVTVGGGSVLEDGVKVWPGAQILRGVRIGARSEVGANAVVMADFPSDSVIFGVPARLAGRTVGADARDLAEQPAHDVTT